LLRPHVAAARKVARAETPLQPWSLPAEAPGDPIELARALMAAAVLAPSTWNTQPWRFEMDGALRVVADTRRALPALDPDQKQMMMSLGAALENLLVAARAYGLRPTVSYFPRGTSNPLVAEVAWSHGDTRRDRGLFQAITERRTNRQEYDGRGIFPQNRSQLIAQVSEECRIHWMDSPEAIRALAEVCRDAAEARTLDRRAAAEQFAWMRRGDDDARTRGDGVTVSSLDYGGPARWLAGRYFNPNSWFLRFGAETAGRVARGAMRSAGAVALLTATRRDEGAWLRGGQCFERFALKATQLGIAQHPLNEAIADERFRDDVLRRFGAAGQEPLMLVRLGHAKRPRPTVRRAVALVSSFRNS
jgi:nitroreductase